MRAVIDRFEGDIAVCELEDKSFKRLKRSSLPKKALEGDVIIIDSTITIDEKATKTKRAQIEKLLDSLWKSD